MRNNWQLRSRSPCFPRTPSPFRCSFFRFWLFWGVPCATHPAKNVKIYIYIYIYMLTPPPMIHIWHCCSVWSQLWLLNLNGCDHIYIYISISIFCRAPLPAELGESRAPGLDRKSPWPWGRGNRGFFWGPGFSTGQGRASRFFWSFPAVFFWLPRPGVFLQKANCACPKGRGSVSLGLQPASFSEKQLKAKGSPKPADGSVGFCFFWVRCSLFSWGPKGEPSLFI